MDTLPQNRKKLPLYDGRSSSGRRGTTMVVYALAHPDDGKVRYIGITNNLLGRFNEHMRMYGGNERKNVWIREILDAHKLPIMRTLEVVDPSHSAREREVAWIKAYLKAGVDLLNDEIDRLQL